MKLSEMSTDQMADAMVLIAEPVANIAADTKVSAALKGYSTSQKKGETVAQTFGKMIGKLAPALLQDHRQDVYAVLSALTEKTVEGIASQKGMQTIADIKACWDGELANFFKSAASTGPDA